jgi:hypothetical protein
MHPSAHAPKNHSRRIRLSVKQSHVGRPASHMYIMMALKALSYFDGCARSTSLGSTEPQLRWAVCGKCQHQCMIWGSVPAGALNTPQPQSATSSLTLKSSLTEALLFTWVLAVILFCLLLGLGCQELNLHSITTRTAWQQLRPSPPNKCMLLSSFNLQPAQKLAPAMHCAAAP